MADFRARPQGGDAGKTGDILDAKFPMERARSARVNVSTRKVKHDESNEVNGDVAEAIPATGRR